MNDKEEIPLSDFVLDAKVSITVENDNHKVSVDIEDQRRKTFLIGAVLVQIGRDDIDKLKGK